MSSPKFAVNEQVIVVSENYPEINGEYIVSEIITNKQFESKYPLFATTGFFYGLVGLSFQGTFRSGQPAPVLFEHVGEHTLRKKHTPSSDSYTSMMDKLKIGSLV